MKNCLEKPTSPTIDVNVDGVPISKSSQSHFELILVKFFSSTTPPKIVVVGVYHGYNKPKPFNNFLQPFIDEAKNLGTYTFNNVRIPICIRCILCDAPARNYCLGTKGFCGYHGCGRCEQEGEYVNNRMTFPDIDFTKRTDISFRNQSDPDHHDSVFLQLPIDLIHQFPLDYLHTVCLGVGKKCVLQWLKVTLILALNSVLMTLKEFLIVWKQFQNTSQVNFKENVVRLKISLTLKGASLEIYCFTSCLLHQRIFYDKMFTNICLLSMLLY